jgi:hypothetical protein
MRYLKANAEGFFVSQGAFPKPCLKEASCLIEDANMERDRPFRGQGLERDVGVFVQITICSKDTNPDPIQPRMRRFQNAHRSVS